MGRRMHKRDKVTGLLLTASKVNSFLQKAEISSLCLRRSSAFVVLLLCAHWMGSLVSARSLKATHWASRVKAYWCIPSCWADSWSWFVLSNKSVGCWACSQITEVCEHCVNINALFVWKLFVHQVTCMIYLTQLEGLKTSGSHHLHDLHAYIVLNIFIAWL